MLDIQIMNLFLFHRKLYQVNVWPWTHGGLIGFFTHNAMLKVLPFISWPWTNGGHLGFVTHNAMSKIFSDNTTMSGLPENHIIDTKNTNLRLFYVENDINLLLDLEQMAAILDISLTMQYLKYFRQHHNVRHTWKPHDRHKKKQEYAPIMSKMISIYCLTLNKWRPSCIFYPQCNVENIFRQYYYVRHTWIPQDRHQEREYISIMSKIISIYCLTLDKWRPSCIFYPQCNVENIFWQYHYVRHTWKP